jgi:hypothetical protein
MKFKGDKQPAALPAAIPIVLASGRSTGLRVGYDIPHQRLPIVAPNRMDRFSGKDSGIVLMLGSPTVAGAAPA